MSEEEIARVAETYPVLRGNAGTYRDVPGFCKSTSLEKVRTHGYVLTPGRYVGAAE
jgi:type I restriction enzyme M protein